MARPAGTDPVLIRRRATAAVIVAGVVLLVGFTFLVLRLSENAIRREARARVDTTAALSARIVREQSLRVSEIVGSYGAQLGTIASPRRGRLDPGDATRVRSVLMALHQDVAGVASATLTDRDGRFVAASPPVSTPAGADLSGRDWYRGARLASPYVSRAALSAGADHRLETVIVVRVLDPGRRTIGYLAVSGSLRTQRFVDAIGRQYGAELTVTDQAGTIVAATGSSVRRLVSLAGDPLVARALRGVRGTRDSRIGGERTVSAASPVAGTGWTVIARVPASTAYKDIPRLRVTVIAAAGIAAFLFLFLVPLLASRLGQARDALGVQEEFQRDLLPSRMPEGVGWIYRASERRMLLGGDFIDALVTPDGGLALLVGDVCGHGPRAAALSASLRAGWRTLASAGVGVSRIELLDALVEGERRDEDLFATLAVAEIDAAGRTLTYALAGHPPPLLLLPDEIHPLERPRGAALGLGATGPRPTGTVDLPDEWALALYTDGLIEARTAPGADRLGVDGLIALARRPDGSTDVAGLLATVRAMGDREPNVLDDDLAFVVVDQRGFAPDPSRAAPAPRSMGRA